MRRRTRMRRAEIRGIPIGIIRAIHGATDHKTQTVGNNSGTGCIGNGRIPVLTIPTGTILGVTAMIMMTGTTIGGTTMTGTGMILATATPTIVGMAAMETTGTMEITIGILDGNTSTKGKLGSGRAFLMRGVNSARVRAEAAGTPAMLEQLISKKIWSGYALRGDRAHAQ